MHMFSCIRTTIEISDELLRQAKKKAVHEGTSLRAVVEAALRRHLEDRPRRSRYRLRWHAERGRLMPGVRLDDRDVLLDVMEGRD